MTTHSAVPEVVLDGSSLERELQGRVAVVEVDDRVGLPVAVSVVLRDPHRDLTDRLGVTMGTSLAVRAGRLGEASQQTLAEAELVSLDVTYSERESTLVLRGYDVSHRLHRGRRSRSFEDVTDGDVLRSVCEQAGVDVGTVDDPGTVHPHLAQLDTTDWDFLQARARECGRIVRVSARRVDLVAPEQAAAAPEPGGLSAEDPRQLVLGRTVQSLEARLSSAELPASVEVRGWSRDTKEPIVGTAPVTAPGTAIGLEPEKVAASAGGGVLTWTATPLADQAEADAVAGALAEVVGSAFATATAVCLGNPGLRAGVPVSLGLAGSLFSGQWTVTTARHTFDTSGYRTTVQLGGSTAHSLPVRPADRGARRPPASLEGVVPGVVTDVADPDGLGRVRVSLPWLSDRYVSDWARVTHPGAGEDRGALLLPEVDDEVLVAFAQGDGRCPYVLGGLHGAVDPPPLDGGAVDSSSGETRLRGLVSRLGHRLVLDDGTRERGITVSTASGDVSLVLDDAATDLAMSARKRVTVDGDTATITARTIELVGDSELQLRAPNVTVRADGTLTLRGGTVRIN